MRPLPPFILGVATVLAFNVRPSGGQPTPYPNATAFVYPFTVISSKQCPTAVTFAANVSIGPPPRTSVSFRWIRSDGAHGSVQTLTNPNPAVYTHNYMRQEHTTWTLGNAGQTFTGWEQIQFIPPNPNTNRATFTLYCR